MAGAMSQANRAIDVASFDLLFPSVNYHILDIPQGSGVVVIVNIGVYGNVRGT